MEPIRQKTMSFMNAARFCFAQTIDEPNRSNSLANLFFMVRVVSVTLLTLNLSYRVFWQVDCPICHEI